MTDWYGIDTVGKLFSSIIDQNNSSFFRLTVVLKDPVDAELFQKAVDMVRQRFSFFFVRLRQGVFWNYLERDTLPYRVKEETELPCAPIKREKGKKENKLVRFFYYKNRLTLEMSHIISDGNGGFELLKAITFVYLSLQGFDIDPENKILSINEVPTIKDYENSFERYAQDVELQREINKANKGFLKIKPKNSYRIRGTNPATKGTNVLTGLISASALKKCAKSYGTTITGYLVSLLIFTLFSARIKYEHNKKPIVVTVPVNLRNFFPSSTLKNFFSVPTVSHMCTAETTFEDIVASVNKQMTENFTKENFQREINRHVAFERHTLSRITPLNIKHPLIRLGFLLFSETKKTITLTNMGVAQFPKDMEKLIEHTEAILYPTPLSPMNCAIASFNDSLTITFSIAIVETDVLRFFFSLLQEQTGSDVSVYSTQRGDIDEV